MRLPRSRHPRAQAPLISRASRRESSRPEPQRRPPACTPRCTAAAPAKRHASAAGQRLLPAPTTRPGARPRALLSSPAHSFPYPTPWRSCCLPRTLRVAPPPAVIWPQCCTRRRTDRHITAITAGSVITTITTITAITAITAGSAALRLHEAASLALAGGQGNRPPLGAPSRARRLGSAAQRVSRPAARISPPDCRSGPGPGDGPRETGRTARASSPPPRVLAAHVLALPPLPHPSLPC